MLQMLLWRSNNRLPNELYTRLIKLIESNHLEKDKFFTTWGKKYDSSDTSVLKSLLEFYGNNFIKEMMIDLGLSSKSKYKSNVWVQMYSSTTTTHAPHDHFYGLKLVSWCHFIKVPNQKCFYFLNDRNQKTYPEQSTSEFIAWPSYLTHGVDQIQEANTNRIIAAGNISLKTFVYNGKSIELKSMF